ncbi:MAG TPA: FAD-dependent oxidoreductase [Thermoanaerobaculia bacterium]|nr:FAD-dependent oxidoreductase [Thermoanaerobaculia bacterium]
MRAEVVIAGAGVIGASVAYHLARRGVRDILVIDRASGFGAGSTSKATGGFRAQFDSETNVRLSLLARERLRVFEDETGVDSGYRPHGYLFLACSGDELDALRRAQAVQHACGLAEARMVSADEARAINPAIGDASIVGGAFCPTDGFIRPMNILRGYADAARRLGVRFQFDCALRSWSEVDARIRIDARGAWSGAPVTPVRRNIAATVPTRLLDESMPMTIWSGDWYHLRVRDGRVLLLLPEEREHWLAEVRRRTWRRVPCLREIEIEECWWGWYEMSPDEHALLGAREDGVYLATGSSGHGVMHAPALGQLMAEMIVDGRTSIDVSALRPQRFVPRASCPP